MAVVLMGIGALLLRPVDERRHERADDGAAAPIPAAAVG
jgi:hypothetical protein